LQDTRQLAVKDSLTELNGQPGNAMFVKRLGRHFEFIRLNKGDRVYDMKGQKIWPAPQ
jgi:hypothetical protein